MSYREFLVERARALFLRGYLPYERKVCVWGYDLKLLCELTAAGLMAWWWVEHWPAFAWCPREALWSWVGFTVWKAGWLGGFVWADFGLGEWYFRQCIHRADCWRVPMVADSGWTGHCCGGTAYVPNIFNTTLEGYEGPKENYPVMVEVWRRLRYRRLRPWDGDPGSGEFGRE